MRRSKVFYGWWIVFYSAILLGVLAPAAVAVANIYQAPVVADFNITNSQFAINNSLVLGMGIFFSPFVSKRLTEGNFKRNYIISLLIYALAYIGYGFAPNMLVFYILSLVVGYGYLGVTVLPVTMLINNWFIQKRGLAMSLALSGLGVGGVVFSQFVTYIINHVGWRQAYMFYGALMLIIIIPIMVFGVKVKPKDVGLEPYGQGFDILEEEGDEEQQDKLELSFRETLKKPFFILLVLGAILIGLVNNAGLGQFPPVLTEMHDAAFSATIISVYSAVGIIGKLVLGHMNDLHGVVKSIVYATSLLAFSYILMLFSENAFLAVLMAIFFGMGNAVGSVMPPLVTSAIYSPEQYSSAYGYVNSGIQLGMTVGSLLAAGIAELSGSYNVSWILMAILAIVTAVTWIGAIRNSEKYR